MQQRYDFDYAEEMVFEFLLAVKMQQHIGWSSECCYTPNGFTVCHSGV